MAKSKAKAEVSKGYNRAPIRITKKKYCMTSKVMGVSPSWHRTTLDGTHHFDWRILAAFQKSLGYLPVYMGELEEWAGTKKGKAALKALDATEETVADYQRRLRAWRRRYPEWYRILEFPKITQ
jgi:hypothetical protein